MAPYKHEHLTQILMHLLSYKIVWNPLKMSDYKPEWNGDSSIIGMAQVLVCFAILQTEEQMVHLCCNQLDQKKGGPFCQFFCSLHPQLASDQSHFPNWAATSDPHPSPNDWPVFAQFYSCPISWYLHCLHISKKILSALTAHIFTLYVLSFLTPTLSLRH